MWHGDLELGLSSPHQQQIRLWVILKRTLDFSRIYGRMGWPSFANHVQLHGRLVYPNTIMVSH